MQAASQIEWLRQTNTQLKYAQSVNVAGQSSKLNEIQNMLRLAGGNPAVDDWAAVGTLLSNAQTGNGASTNTLDFGQDFLISDVLLRFVTTVGATPTCTYAIEGSRDKVTWTAMFYAASGTPDTITNATFVTTTATTKIMILRGINQGYRYLRVNYSANTNVTNTVDVAVL